MQAGGVEEDWAEVWLSEEALAAVDRRAFEVRRPRSHPATGVRRRARARPS